MSFASLFLTIACLAQVEPIRFEAVALPFQFDNGTRKRHDLVEIMGGGVGLIDVDGDGWLDIYLCQGGPLLPKPGRADPPCQLFLNKRDGTFDNISARANAPGPRYAMGVAVGDFDNDGKDDLFVTGWREQRLYQNLGGGVLRDVTDQAGVQSDRWGTSAAFLDFDNDGRLDLYVATYVKFDPLTAPYTAAPDGKADYPGPEDFPAELDHLYHNEGNGKFTDVAQQAGIALPDGRGLGVVASDLDDDGKIDLYVANDGTPARLFRNQGNGTFEDIGTAAGVALDGGGNPIAGMGVARGDLDGDGRLDLCVTNFYGRSTLLFQNEGEGRYSDRSDLFGLTTATRRFLGFGLALVDLDSDGRLDLIQANGHVLDRARLGQPFAMTPLVFQKQKGRLVDVSASAGAAFRTARVGRGLAVGDLDNDGRIDAVVASIDQPPVILWNRSKSRPCLVLDLKAANGSAVGARVVVSTRERTTIHEVTGGGSYLSASDRRIFAGMGAAASADRVRVSWPSGKVETWDKLRPGRVHMLREGQGTAATRTKPGDRKPAPSAIP